MSTRDACSASLVGTSALAAASSPLGQLLETPGSCCRWSPGGSRCHFLKKWLGSTCALSILSYLDYQPGVASREEKVRVLDP